MMNNTKSAAFFIDKALKSGPNQSAIRGVSGRRPVSRRLPRRVVHGPVIVGLLSLLNSGAVAQTKKPANSGPVAKAAAKTTEITYARDIAPIVAQRCASCHRPDGAGPFSFLRYQDVFRRAEQVAVVTQSRYMPPWKPTAGGPFLDNPRLTDAQIGLIQQWVREGAKPGTLDAAPAPPKFKDGWKLGTPDLILEMPDTFTLRAEATETQEIYRAFILPVPITEDKSVIAVEYLPGNPRIVRHASVYTDASRIDRKLQSQSGAVGYTAFHAGLPAHPAGTLYEWTPGVAPHFLPAGVGMSLKKGADLVLQLHFAPTGRPETERSRIGLYFAKKPTVPAATIALGASEVYFKPGAKATVTDSYTLPVAAQLFGLVPNAHNVCTRFKATATLPDGTKKALLEIDDWDLDWKAPYRFAAPLNLPAQTKIDLEIVFDNTRVNPRDPRRRPHFVIPGWGTMDEMASLWLLVAPAKASDSAVLQSSLPPASHKPTVSLNSDDEGN